MDLIKVKEMLDVMDAKDDNGQLIPWSMTFVTCNLKKQTGGKRITVKDCILVGGSVSNSNLRNPNHGKNYTRNFRSIHNNEIREFHPLLVETFNDMRVVL